MNRIDFDKIAEDVRNWGKWGPEDQKGTLNFIDPESLLRATKAVQQGKLFHLGLEFGKTGPQTGEPRTNPQYYVTALFNVINPEVPDVVYSDDVIHMHLQSATQWDALGHTHYGGELYNGFSSRECFSMEGTSKCGVEHMANPGIMSRGILLDIAKLKGVDRLPIDTIITPDDLNAACEAQGVSFKPGDILLVRTGHMQHFINDDDRATYSSVIAQPGLSPRCAEWVSDKSIAAICADNATVEHVTMEMYGAEMPMPLHMLCLRDMGCPLGEMFNMEALAEDCAKDGKYEFLLSAPPLGVTGAYGSPVNPLVLK